MNRYRLIEGDALERLCELPAAAVQCVVTSPPYWGLRDYGTVGQIGLERTPGEYVTNMVAVFREVRRVLRDDGTLWLNLGDCYMGGGRGGGAEDCKQRTNVGSLDAAPNLRCAGFKPKNLVGIPWRVAFALQADGWWLRSDIVWSKPNPMPESVTDRPTKAHEYVFLLTKNERYFYDADAVREPAVNAGEWCAPGAGNLTDPVDEVNDRHARPRRAIFVDPAGRNRRSVWTIATQPYSGAHFATFPEALVEPCILAATSERGACAKCGAPRRREVDVEPMVFRHSEREAAKHAQGLVTALHGTLVEPAKRKTTGWSPSCDCAEQETRPCVVLDPFFGSGTVGVVALKRGREAWGIELNPKYAQLARERIEGDAPLLNRAVP